MDNVQNVFHFHCVTLFMLFNIKEGLPMHRGDCDGFYM
jgi:hypothetical protein